MAGRSSCPACGTILRVRDRSYVGRRFHCPECKAALRIETVSEDGTFTTRRMSAEEIAKAERERQAHAHRDKIQLTNEPTRSWFSRTINSPLTAAWLLAIAIMTFVAVIALAPRVRFSTVKPSAKKEGLDKEAREPVVETPGTTEQPTESTAPPPTQKEPDPPATVVDVPAISALTPANLDAPLVWPPPVVPEVVEPNAPPQPPKFTIQQKLDQEITGYKQPPIRRRELIVALREQLGAPILYDVQDLGSAELEKTVSFDLQATKMRKVIQVVADEAGWEVLVEDNGLRLTRKQASRDP